MIEKGSSYLSSPDLTPHNEKIRHLRIVISDFDEIDRALVVPITSWHDNARAQDDSCILDVGDHEFIKHKSWADFSRAEAMSYAVIERNIRENIFIEKEKISPELLKRLQEGAKTSDFLPQSFYRFFEDF